MGNPHDVNEGAVATRGFRREGHNTFHGIQCIQHLNKKQDLTKTYYNLSLFSILMEDGMNEFLYLLSLQFSILNISLRVTFEIIGSECVLGF